MKLTQSITTGYCEDLLAKWRKDLDLSNKEKSQLQKELKTLDSQLERFSSKKVRVAVYGRVGVGKSSLLNALLGEDIFATDVAHGCTRKASASSWRENIRGINKIQLIDTPGIDEINSPGKDSLAREVAISSDLILFILDSDISRIEIEALKKLLISKKPILLILNRSDQWEENQLCNVIESIRFRLPKTAKDLNLKVVAAAPRQAKVQPNGTIRSEKVTPRINELSKILKSTLQTEGERLLSINTLLQADIFFEALRQLRVKQNKIAAQSTIAKFAAIKASGVALNPFIIFDFAGSLACDTALVIELSKIYSLQMRGPAARELLKKASIYNSFIGLTQLFIQFLLGGLRQIMLLVSPLTGGITLVSTFPVALAQAVLAIQTTKATGNLAAKIFAQGKNIKGGKPSAVLIKLSESQPYINSWLRTYPNRTQNSGRHIDSMLP